MKKFTVILVALLLAVVMVFSLVACNQTGGEDLLFGKELLKLPGQIDILTALDNGSADIGVFDSIMANYYSSTGSYAGKIKVLDFNLIEEEYGIAAKKGNKALISKINEALIALSDNGTLTEIAETYELENDLLVTPTTVNPFADNTTAWADSVTQNKLVVGYTMFAPIAYEDANNELTGFDILLAKAVVNYLNTKYSATVALEFELIDWNSKEALLENGSIDLVWNGMTINDERLENMQISLPYLANKQAAVVRKADFEKYSKITPFLTNARKAIIAVENGSVAEDLMLI